MELNCHDNFNDEMEEDEDDNNKAYFDGDDDLVYDDKLDGESDNDEFYGDGGWLLPSMEANWSKSLLFDEDTDDECDPYLHDRWQDGKLSCDVNERLIDKRRL